jgi:hypothetical protein
MPSIFVASSLGAAVFDVLLREAGDAHRFAGANQLQRICTVWF